MRLTYFALIILLVSCGQIKPMEYGSLKGNVYWKYNNFVGNRPDAGSDVYVYSVDDSVRIYATKTDVRGDYSIDSVPVGYYLVVIKSENTRTDAYDCFSELNRNKRFIDSVFRIDITSILNRYNDKIESLKEQASKGLTDNEGMKALNAYQTFNDSAAVYCEKAIDSLPKKIKSEFIIIGEGGPKLDIKSVSIQKGKTENIITDFGITYM